MATSRAAIAETIADLRAKPVSADILLRAREPLAESFENQFKTNSGWLALVARAQSEPDRIERQTRARVRLLAVSPADVQALALRYLDRAAAVEITVLPEGTGALTSH